MHKQASRKKYLHFIESILVGLGAFVSLSFIGLIAEKAESMMIIAPFGATAVLLFSAPKSNFSKPLNIFGGYLISTIIAIVVLTYTDGGWLSTGVALGLTIMLMHFANVIHPPAGANLLVIAQGDISWYLVEPLFIGLLILIIFSISIEKIKQKLSKLNLP